MFRWAGVLALGALLGCDSKRANESWSALATCLAGADANAPIATRVQVLRRAQLGSWGQTGESSWPGRCDAHAQALYGVSEGAKALRSELAQGLRCTDEPKSCRFASDNVVSTATKLWEAAATAGLKLEIASGVAGPKLISEPLVDQKTWRSFSAVPGRVVGPRLSPDGSARLVLSGREGRQRLQLCKLSQGLAGISCLAAHADVPEFPGHSVELTSDGRGPFAAGLTPDGLVAFNLETGERSDVRGTTGQLVSDGLAIEAGTVAPERRSVVIGGGLDGGVVRSRLEKGYVLVEIRDGKASREKPIAIEPLGKPAVLGGRLAFVTYEDDTERSARALSDAGLKPSSTAGDFEGELRGCSVGARLAVAAYAGHRGQRGAKPTLGQDKTRFALLFHDGSTLSKSSSASLPFDRGIDSGLVCTGAGASVAWARSIENGIEVGRLDCTPEGCSTKEQKLPGLESKWWWAVAPLGDKLLLVWRSGLGDTRFRLAPLAELATAPDRLLFDSPDFGGPAAAEATQAASEQAALLLFNEQKPVAVRVGADGNVRVLTP